MRDVFFKHQVVSGIVALILCSASASGQRLDPTQYVRVYGRVLDSLTGQPVAGVDVRLTDWQGVVWTDSLGYFSLHWVAPGRANFLLRCPSRSAFKGRRLRGSGLTLRAGDTIQVELLIDATGGCVTPALRSVGGEFQGFWASGFEHSEFVPCAPAPQVPRESGDSVPLAAWVSFTEEARTQLHWPEEQTRSKAGYYVRFYGTLSGPGAYGHLGVADYGLTVTEVRELSVSAPGSCREE
jgi:hypothetical protein